MTGISKLNENRKKHFFQNRMKKIQAQFKQLVGLKITDPLCNIWIKYFTTNFPTKVSEIPNNSSLQSQYELFDIHTIPQTELFYNSQEVESFPRQRLPSFLKFNIKLNRCYINFAKELQSIKDVNKDYQWIVIGTAPFLMRFAIAFFYQFQKKFDVLLLNENTDDFSLDFVDDFIYVHEILMLENNQCFSDYIQVFYKFLFFLENNILLIFKRDKSFSVVKFVESLFLHATGWHSVVNIINSQHFPLISFISLYTSMVVASGSFNEKFEDGIELFINTFLVKEKDKDFLHNDSIIHLVTIICNSFIAISQEYHKGSIEFINFGSNLFALLEQISPIQVIHVEPPYHSIDYQYLAKSIISYMRNAFLLFVNEEPKLIESPKPNLTRELFDNHEFKFVQNKFVSIELLKSDKLNQNINSQFIPKILKAENISSIFNNLTSLLQKNKNLMVFFINNVLENLKKDSLLLQYFVLTTLYLFEPSIECSIINQKNLWSNLINKCVIYKVSIYGNEIQYLTTDLIYKCFQIQLSDQKGIIDSLINLMNETYSKTIFEILNKILIAFPENFVKAIRNTSFISNLFEIDSKLRSELILSRPSDQIIELRTLIFSIIIKISKILDGVEQLLSSASQRDYFFSLLFETEIQNLVIDIISSAIIKESLMSKIVDSINVILCSSLTNVNDPSWKKLVNNILKMYIYIPQEYMLIISKYIISSSTLSTFQKIALSSKDFYFGMSIFNFLVALSVSSKYFSDAIHNPQWNFHQTWVEVFSRTKITKDNLNLLKKMTFLDTNEIQNIEGLNILVTIALSTPFENEILDLLLNMCESSQINCYKCSQANLTTVFLKKLETNPKNKEMLLKFLCLIGSSSFNPDELNIFLHSLQKDTTETGIPLINVFKELVSVSVNSDIHSYFHFDGKNSKFLLDCFRVEQKFGISFNIRFVKETLIGSNYIFTLTNESHQGHQFVHLFMTNGKLFFSLSTVQFQVEKEIKPNVWYDINISIRSDKTTIMIDNVIAGCFSTNRKFIFSPNNVSFKINNIQADIDKITFYDQQGNVGACYSAGVMNNSVCTNTYEGKDKYGSAYFEGNYVFYTLNIINAIKNCGGITILLPLFETIKNEKYSIEYFHTLLYIIKMISEHKEEMFFEQDFFKAISVLLPETINEETLQYLFDIYNSFKSHELKAEMILNIWCNWMVMKQYNKEIMNLLLNKYLITILAQNKTFFFSVFSFKSFILSFENLCLDEGGTKSCFSFLKKLKSYQFTPNDANNLIISIIDTSNMPYFESALEMIYSLIGIDESLSEVITYEPFYRIFTHFSEVLHIKSINTILFIYSENHNNILLSKDIVRSLNGYQITQSSTRTLDHLINIFFGNITPGSGISAEKEPFVFSTTNIPLIQNSQFLPLICYSLHIFKKERLSAFLNILNNSIIKYKSSQFKISECYMWPFWILFLSNFDDDNNKPKWIECLAIIYNSLLGQENNFTMNEIFSFIFIFTQTYNYNYYDFTLMFFKAILKYNKDEEILLEYFKFLLFIPAQSSTRNEFYHLDFHLLSGYLSTHDINSPNYILVQDIQVESAQQLLDYYLVTNPNQCSRIVYFVNEMVPIAELLTATIHFLSIKNHDLSLKYFECFMKINQLKGNKKCLQLLAKDFSCDDIKLPKDLSQDKNDENDILIKLNTYCDKIQKSMYTITKNILSIINDCLFMLFNPKSTQTSAIFHYKSEKIQNKMMMERIFIQNERVWNSIKSILFGYGGFWSNGNQKLHWKFDNSIDLIGGRTRMKINKNFNDHKDASTATKILKNKNEIDANSINRYVDTFTDEKQEKMNEQDIQLKLKCEMLRVDSIYKGTMYFLTNSITFESEIILRANGKPRNKKQKIIEINFESIVLVLKRDYLNADVAFEIFLKNRKSYFFIFSKSDRTIFFNALKKSNVSGLQLSTNAKFFEELGIQRKWKRGKMTDYQYLYWVNMFSGRSFNNISQYPVFPWVIANNYSDSIDLNDEKNYRDLKKSICGLNQERFETLMNLYNEVKDEMKLSCLLRFHFSTPAYVIHYLIRTEPFTTLHIELQDGHFDTPSRLFKSIPSTFRTCLNENDFRELIPEFFSTPEFLINSENFDLGDDSINNVELPKWAKNPEEFITINRIALESSYVSKNLHHWIDLIFGYKQQSIEDANNYHPYSDPAYVNSLTDEEEKRFAKSHIANFGVNPLKLFPSPHPQRIFIPSQHNFQEEQNLQFITIARSVNLLKMWCCYNELYYLQFQGDIYSFPLDKFAPDKPLVIKPASKVILHFPFALRETNNISKHISVLGNEKYLFVSNPWSENFDMIDYNDAHGKILHTFEGHSAVIVDLKVDTEYAISSAHDSSLYIWDIKKQRFVSSIFAHTTKVVCLDYSYTIDLIASVDISGKFSYSSAIKRKFIRSIQLDYIPKQIMVSNLGYILVFQETFVLGDVTTTIESYDLSQRKISTCKIPGSISSSCLCEFDDCSTYICVSMSTMKVYMYCVYDLRRVACSVVPSLVKSCTFSTERQMLFFYLENGDLVYSSIN